MKKAIKIKNIQDIQKINQIVSNYSFDIWLESASGMVDAKSVLGMFAMGLNEPMSIVLEDGTDASSLFHDLAAYMDIND